MKIYVVYFTSRNGETLGVRRNEGAVINAIKSWSVIQYNHDNERSPINIHQVTAIISRHTNKYLNVDVSINNKLYDHHLVDIFNTDDPLIDM